LSSKLADAEARPDDSAEQDGHCEEWQVGSQRLQGYDVAQQAWYRVTENEYLRQDHAGRPS
jgi:hypothetical protein